MKVMERVIAMTEDRLMVNGRPTTQTQMQQRVRWTPCSGVVDNAFDDLLVPASRSMPSDKAKIQTVANTTHAARKMLIESPWKRSPSRLLVFIIIHIAPARRPAVARPRPGRRTIQRG